jgi:DNA-binding MarR family transcriptional regulator
MRRSGPDDDGRPGDRVDEVQAAWRVELPGLDVGSIALVGRLLEVAHRIERARGAALAEVGSDRATFDLLAGLRRSGPPHRMTVGDLQRISLVTTGAVSQRVERAERAGLVRRTTTPEDARKVVVELTQAGHEAVVVQLRAVLAADEESLRPLGSRQREMVQVVLREWVAGLGVEAERRTAGLPEGETGRSAT